MFNWFKPSIPSQPKNYDVGDLYYDPNNKITNVYTGSSWTSIQPADTINSTTLTIKNRDILEELDELREAMLLLTRDLKLEEQYPELKQAYDDYMELYRSIKIADKLAKTGDT